MFQAGASYYGVSDIEVLARDTHKFESRYLDTLIGPYPAARDVYRARSPIHFVDRLSCSLILFQGLEDKVVPPNQSEMMAAAVRAKGLPVAYLASEVSSTGSGKLRPSCGASKPSCSSTDGCLVSHRRTKSRRSRSTTFEGADDRPSGGGRVQEPLYFETAASSICFVRSIG